jgi:thymidylate synthase (FAD)
MDPTRAMDITNLTSLCAECHRKVHHTRESEVEFARQLKGILPPELEQAARRTGEHRLVAHAVQVAGLEFVGHRQTYDLSVEGPWHNFVANGMVVHNSEFNEISGRYVEFPPDEFYAPERFRQQAKVNKQGSEGEIAVEHREAAAGAYLESCQASVAQYKALLAMGVCREQAPRPALALYSEVRPSAAGRGSLHPPRGRTPVGNQQYAHAVRKLVEQVYPVGLKALVGEAP